MLRQTQTVLWRLGALAALALGIIGTVLPVLPTVPFLILAAWAAGKGWPALQNWLLAHPTYGPYIRNWRERGAVPRKAKILAIAMMSISALSLQLTSAPLWVRIVVPIAMLAIAVWLWTRPDS
jgi:uncharacterized membrane protein YbaN (DUF454 family)